MSHTRRLDSDQLRNLSLWLKDQRIDLNAKKRRELSDVLQVGAIVKKFHNRLVDLNPYTPSRNSLALKLKNWEVFNLKVLKKLHIKLLESEIKDLAQGKIGAIELLFYDLFVANTNPKAPKKAKEPPKISSKSMKECKESLQIPNETLQGPNESLQRPNESLKSTREWLKSRALTFNHMSRPAPVLALSEMLIVDAGQTINGKKLEQPFSVVPYDIYEKAMRQSSAKDAFISRLEEKSKYLEDIIALKENRINLIMTQTCKLSSTLMYLHSNRKQNMDQLCSTSGP
ncbi:uncharacterized protein DMAD_06218 [Drosophila madeirensis]|uniref:CH-like domain-containing protein n=1 Tax=Drosophila madeirensis TaxID=30013 RepID=A0AAU9FQS8_DROMD